MTQFDLSLAISFFLIFLVGYCLLIYIRQTNRRLDRQQFTINTLMTERYQAALEGLEERPEGEKNGD